MRLTELHLRNFRNYEALDYMPAPHLNILVGENAAGKTNILESIFYAALGKSHRTSRDAELIRFEEGYASVKLSLDTTAGTRTIDIGLAKNEKKRLLVDGRRLERSGELMGCLNVVLFAPEDLTLVKEGPAERRRFMNMALSQQYPGYYYLLQAYNAALKQRNALLKSDEVYPEEMYLPWEEQLADAGSRITHFRERFSGELAKKAEEIHLRMTGGKERLDIRYLPCCEELYEKEAFLNKLTETRRTDMFRGGTGTGPHRDDMGIEADGIDLRKFGSQGQQRTAALSLKLSEIELVKKITGNTPILLLDDVLSELDSNRQNYLINSINNIQTLITCTGLDEFVNSRIVINKIFKVHDGTVTSNNNQ